MISQEQRHLPYTNEIIHISKHFDLYYQELIDRKISLNLLRSFISCQTLNNHYKRLLKEHIQDITHHYSTIDKYFISSNSLTRKEEIEANYDGETPFNGLISYLKTLTGKNLLEANIITIETPGKFSHLETLINFMDSKSFFSCSRIEDQPALNYIQYDFHERKIAVNGITIAYGQFNYAPTHWALLGSNNLRNWSVIFEQSNTFDNNPSPLQTFTFQASTPFRFLRFTIFKNNISKKAIAEKRNTISLAGLEYFGKLIL